MDIIKSSENPKPLFSIMVIYGININLRLGTFKVQIRNLVGGRKVNQTCGNTLETLEHLLLKFEKY